MGELVPQNNQLAQNDGQLQFTREQIDMIKNMYAKGSTDLEFKHYLYVAQKRGLDPLAGQIHAIKRYSENHEGNHEGKREGKREGKLSIQVSIDGFRLIADRTGRYAGNDLPKFNERNGKLISCEYTVYKFVEGVRCPFVAIAYFEEYKQIKKGGGLNVMWNNKPHIMLSKCAEALALRMAFPQELSGLYTHDEMMQADNEFAIQEQPITVQKKEQPKPKITKKEACYKMALDDAYLDTESPKALLGLAKNLAQYEGLVSNEAPEKAKADWEHITSNFNGTSVPEQWPRDTLIRFIKMLVGEPEPIEDTVEGGDNIK